MDLYIYNNWDSTTKRQTGELKTPIVASLEDLGNDYTRQLDICCLRDYSYVYKDYLQYRDSVKDVLNTKGWSSLDDKEKDVVIELHLKEDSKSYDDSNIDKYIYLTSKGVLPQDVSPFLKKAYSLHHLKDKEASRERGDSLDIYNVILSYLEPLSAVEFYDIASELIRRWKEEGLKGLDDGSSKKGFFDWLVSSNGYEGFGLAEQNLTYIKGDALELADEILKIARHGYYDS